MPSLPKYRAIHDICSKRDGKAGGSRVVLAMKMAEAAFRQVAAANIMEQSFSTRFHGWS